jgi:hypothetical protein
VRCLSHVAHDLLLIGNQTRPDITCSNITPAAAVRPVFEVDEDIILPLHHSSLSGMVPTCRQSVHATILFVLVMRCPMHCQSSLGF